MSLSFLYDKLLQRSFAYQIGIFSNEKEKKNKNYKQKCKSFKINNNNLVWHAFTHLLLTDTDDTMPVLLSPFFSFFIKYYIIIMHFTSNIYDNQRYIEEWRQVFVINLLYQKNIFRFRYFFLWSRTYASFQIRDDQFMY